MANGVLKECEICKGKTRELNLFRFKTWMVCGGCFQRMQDNAIDSWSAQRHEAEIKGSPLPRQSEMYD